MEGGTGGRDRESRMEGREGAGRDTQSALGTQTMGRQMRCRRQAADTTPAAMRGERAARVKRRQKPLSTYDLGARLNLSQPHSVIQAFVAFQSAKGCARHWQYKARQQRKVRRGEGRKRRQERGRGKGRVGSRGRRGPIWELCLVRETESGGLTD